MKKIAVIGAGNAGFAMSAHLLSHGHTVHLWNRSQEGVIEDVQQNGITCSGAYTGIFYPQMITTDIAQAIKGVQFILVTVPAHAHEEVITLIAEHLQDDQIIILNPGRTCGAWIANKIIRNKRDGLNVIVAEAQTIIYTCRKVSNCAVHIYTLKQMVAIAACKTVQTTTVIDALPTCLKQHFFAATHWLETSLGNVGMILHCAPVLLNIGWIESKQTPFKYYYEGITPTIANFLEKMDRERLAVASALGINIDSVTQWMYKVYSVKGDHLYECIQSNEKYTEIDAPKSLEHRYLYEDVSTGLVPISELGKIVNIETPCIDLIITLAHHVTGFDFRKNGRNLDTLGLSQLNSNQLKDIFFKDCQI